MSEPLLPADPPDGSQLTGSWPARIPLMLSSPHSGTRYHQRFENLALLSTSELSALDDGPLDDLLAFAGELGTALVHARYARAVVDINRAPQECLPFLIEPAGSRHVQVTPRSRAGLGVVPTRIGSRAIYDRALPSDDLAWRIDRVHAGYHDYLARLHRDLAKRFGVALLLDMHSMPDNVARAEGRDVDVAIGNRHGQSCSNELAHFALGCLAELGLRAAINQPYAGGYVTAHHGRPRHGRPALQIELRRSLFMNDERELHAGAAGLSNRLRQFCARMAAYVQSDAIDIAVDAA